MPTLDAAVPCLQLSVLGEGGLRDERLELNVAQFYDLLAQLERAASFAGYLAAATP